MDATAEAVGLNLAVDAPCKAVDASGRHPHMRRIWPALAGSWPARRCLKRADFRTASGMPAPLLRRDTMRRTGCRGLDPAVRLCRIGRTLASRHRHQVRRATSRPRPCPPRASITAGPSARRPPPQPGSCHPPPHAPQAPPCARRTAGPSAPASAAGRTASGRCTGGSRNPCRTSRR